MPFNPQANPDLAGKAMYEGIMKAGSALGKAASSIVGDYFKDMHEKAKKKAMFQAQGGFLSSIPGQMQGGFDQDYNQQFGNLAQAGFDQNQQFGGYQGGFDQSYGQAFGGNV